MKHKEFKSSVRVIVTATYFLPASKKFPSTMTIDKVARFSMKKPPVKKVERIRRQEAKRV